MNSWYIIRFTILWSMTESMTESFCYFLNIAVKEIKDIFTIQKQFLIQFLKGKIDFCYFF